MSSIVTATEWGTTIVSNEDALNNITNIFTNTFSQTPNLSPSSLTGAFIQELTNQYINVSSTTAYVTTNVYSLASSSGIFLEGIGGLFDIAKGQPTYTKVICSVLGNFGTVIKKGSAVSDGTYIYTTDSDVVVGLLGVQISVTCLTSGAIVVPENSITTIITPISGWSSVNNPSAGITGSSGQNDTAYRYTIKYCQAINGRGVVESLYAVFANFMNQTGATTVSYNGISYPFIQGFFIFVNNASEAQSISPELPDVPVGGVYVTLYAPQFLNDPAEAINNQQYIAGLIMNQLGAGQTLNLVDTTTYSTAQNFSIDYTNTTYPAIDRVTVKFDSPAPAPISFAFTIKIYNTTLSPAAIITNVKNAILSQFYFGYQNYDPCQMNVAINTVDYILTIINAVGSASTITTQEIRFVGSSTAGTTLSVPLSQVATLNPSNITINAILG